jgi:phosphoserine phosphatase RsbU/P
MVNALHPDDRRLGKLRKLTEVSRALTYALSLHEVLSLASRCACELLEADKALLLMTNDEGLLQVRAATGVDPESYRDFREPLSEKVLGSIRRLLGSDAPHVLVVPLVVGGDVSGVLGVARAGEPLESDENEWLLSALADQAALALEKTRLDEVAQFRERLMGIVGHDLKNPVGAIRMATDMMLRSNGLDERQAKLTRHIANSAARMAEMISQLLDFAQSRLGGGIPIKPELVRAEDFCRQAIEELELAHPSGKLSLESQSHASGLWDRGRLMQVVSNLVSNAIQHGDADEAVVIRTFDDGMACVIEVHNQGPPIPENMLPHVFDPFRQGRESELRPATNLGLGLFIAQQIVAAHHGSITVSSSSEAGTTFTVRLPRRSEG